MALPADFMSRVIDWPGLSGPGYVNLHWTVPPSQGQGVRGRPYKEVRDLVNDALSMAANPSKIKEIYFCLSVQKDHGGQTKFGKLKAHRHQSKALSLKSLWIDIDCGHGKDYATQTEALTALTQFVADENLPPPTALVNSGGGIHAYWVSDKPLTVEQWRPYAEGLKSLVLQHKLAKDAGLISDCARVLRVPGSFNNKIDGLPRPVKLLHLHETDYDFAATPALARLATLVKIAPAKVTAAVSGAAFELPAAFAGGPAAAWAGLTDSLNAGIERRDLSLPLLVDQAIVKCQHFRDCAVTHGANHGQGLWALTLLACTFLEDGGAWAQNFSKGYPTYDPGEVENKYNEKLAYKAANDLGWPSCHAFEGEGAKCAGCPFRGTISSPLALCERQDPPQPAPVAFAQAEAEAELDLPEGFTLNDKGIICEILEKTDPKTMAVSTEYVPLFMCKLRNFHAQGGVRKLLFETALDKGHWDEVQIDETKDFINDTTIVTALRKFGVKPNTNLVGYPKRIINFMTSYMAKIDAEKERQKAVAFGWLHADEKKVLNDKPLGFAYGGQVYMADRSIRPAGCSDPMLQATYTPLGAVDPWWDMLHMVTAQHHPALEAIVASAFGAPLMTPIGLYNGVICAWSNGSGARKSTSVQIGASVWGNPKISKERPLSTNKGILRKLGTIKSLPVYWDEINDVTKMDEIRLILGALTEGSRGSVLFQSGDMRPADEWQTCMLIGANKSLYENIKANVKDTDAQLQRVFEFEVEKRDAPGNHADIDPVLNSLDRNFGQLGIEYAKFLATNMDMIYTTVRVTRTRFCAETGAREEERFRTGAATGIYCGAVFANQLGCDFNLDELWAFLKSEFIKQTEFIRGSTIVAGTADNTQDTISQFMKFAVKNSLWIDRLPARGGSQAVVYIAGPTSAHPEKINIRFAISDRVMDLSKTALSDWLLQRKQNSDGVFIGLRKHFAATEIKKVSLGVGSGLMGPRETIIRVPIDDASPWLADLWTHTPPDQRGVTAAVTTGITPSTQAAEDLATVREAA